MPVLFICCAILALLLMHNIKRSSRLSKKDSEDFWERERKASFSRKKDISELRLLSTTEQELPFRETSNEKEQQLQNAVRENLKTPMLNLSGMTNTDIKLSYGMANFPLLSSYDQNYNLYLRNLYQWGNYLYEIGEEDTVRNLYEYAISIGCDIRPVYLTLGQIYCHHSEINKISELIEQAEELPEFNRIPIQKGLKEIIQSY